MESYTKLKPFVGISFGMVELNILKSIWSHGIKFVNLKKKGGLGIKDDIIWNKVAVGKLAWWITSKADHLWVKWVNHTYIKNKEWHTYSLPAFSSWYWRKICQVKDTFNEAYQQNLWSETIGNEYSIAKGYEFLRDKGETMNWHNMVWNTWSLPKHGFMAWIYQHKNMNTKDKLYKLGICSDDTCCICGHQTETMDHIFFACDYNKAVIKIVGHGIGVLLPTQNLREWSLRRGGSKIRFELLNAVLNACIYHVWRQRNLSRYELTIDCPRKVASTIVDEMKIRIKGCLMTASPTDKIWL
ncbi:uncharacterized protein LOC141602104 [Silene latifolia]|uniref:uncharacterized protein LOC141602104 n=1 Tax=Silene latifolia TaxID=37657 RepID=UPI003D77CF86